MHRCVVVAVAVVSLSGCAYLEKGGQVQANPVVQGGVMVASKAQCQKFAQNDPQNAKTTAQYLQTLANATQACVDGLEVGIAVQGMAAPK